MAALPFAGVVRLPSGAHEPLDLPRAEIELRAVAAHAREALARAAAAARLSFEFSVSRGGVASSGALEALLAHGVPVLLVRSGAS